ncbi:MAG TPA: cupin domain-containing protein [Acidimicrobiia bacterium]|nr:cupin domain-containing protein [Acidimicrobiia bacterium]
MEWTTGVASEIETFEIVAETPELRMVLLTLAEGQEVPWHLHSEVTDTFFCVEGPMVVETRDPVERHDLVAGGMCTVPAGRPHRVSGKGGGRCKFGVLQGVGAYDFRSLGSPDAVS